MPSPDPVVEYEYSPGESPCLAVVTAIGAISNRDPLETEPLCEYVDPDALNALFQSGSTRERRATELHVEFGVDDYSITVTADCVRVQENVTKSQ